MKHSNPLKHLLNPFVYLFIINIIIDIPYFLKLIGCFLFTFGIIFSEIELKNIYNKIENYTNE